MAEKDLSLIDNDGVHRLQVGILRQAMSDYKCALTGRKKFFSDRRAWSTEELEDWFLSQYGQMLSDGNGEEIIERCRKEVGAPLQASYGRERKGVRGMLVVATMEISKRKVAGRDIREDLAKYIAGFGGTRVLQVREVQLPKRGEQK